MNGNNPDLKSQFNVLYTIYTALVIGQLLFFAVSIFLIESGKLQPDQSLNGVFNILIPVLGILSMFGSYRLYNFKVATIKSGLNVLQKLEQFRTIKIIQWAVLEGAGFFSLVAFLLTGNYLYVVVFLFLIGYTILNRPIKENFINDCKISGTDKSLLF